MTKDYRNDTIVVHWDAARCIHTGICTRKLPAVFDIAKRPWITVDAATADAIADAVVTCPTSALRYERRRLALCRCGADQAIEAASPGEICNPQEFDA